MTDPVRLGEVELTRIGLGTNRLTNTPGHRRLLEEALDAGVNLIDTAHTYARGESEQTIGAALGTVPDDVVVATKGGWNDGRPQALHAEIEESLRRLRTDTITLYYLHRVHADVPIETSLEAIREHRDRGRIRHVGVSNVGVAEIERARQVVPIDVVQDHYSRTERGHDDVVDHCAERGIVFVPYFPLRGRDGPALDRVARDHAATPAQVALAWLLKRSPTMTPIPGTTSAEHVRENLAALDLELTDAEYDALA